MTRGLYSIEQLMQGGAPAAPADPNAPPAPAPAPGEGAAAGGVDYELLYGDPEKDPPTTGIAPYLTTWPISAINLNTAFPEVLLAIWPEKDHEEKEEDQAKFWEDDNALAKEMVEKVQEHRIDPQFQGGGGTQPPGGGTQPPGGGTQPPGGGGGAGASRSWSGEAFSEVTQLKDVDDKLSKIFPADAGGQGGGGQGGGGQGGGGQGGGGEESSFEFQRALTVKSRFYAVRVTASVGEVEAVYRMVVYRSKEDEVSVLLLEAVPE
jgi:hypothetical protein